MKILVWQWGRLGAGPRFGACLAEALRGRPGIEVTLSLCRDAEIMEGPNPPRCEMPVRTYRGMASFLLRLATAPLVLPFLLVRLCRFAPDLAICAMPGPLDVLMAVALRLIGARLVVVVHDADSHPGDGFPLQMLLQRLLCRCAGGLAVLCRHVGTRLQQQRLVGVGRLKLIPFEHPPFAFDMPAAEDSTGQDARARRLLCFGRLLPYKGLDLLAGALAALPPDVPISVRVVGRGPESAALDALRGCRGVTVENRWVPETEIGALLAWSDALILPYREASQSGVAAAALAAGRPVIATRVGGLREQLSGARQVVLCEPDAASLARGIRLWLEAPAKIAEPADAAAAWQQAASKLLLAIGTALPPKIRAPKVWNGDGARPAALDDPLSGEPVRATRLLGRQ
jgi:glycosyltransferase involved in cell wall biosynthesis